MLTSEYSFEQYAVEHNKTYGSAEVAARRAAFSANLDKILAHNAKASATFKMGVNHYADMTSEEFKAYYRGYSGNSRGQLTEGAQEPDFVAFPVEALPDAVDWRKQNKVTPVKNQGGCGSCWAFSATETLESHIAIAHDKLFELSTQQITMCTPNPQQCGGTGGCEGATQWLGFNYTQHSPGVTTELHYRYTGSDSECRMNKIKPVVGIKGYVRLPTNNYTMLMNAVAIIGPISVSGAAEPWQLYEEGVFNEECGFDVDHGIQAVGYGTDPDSGLTYWLIRNSWGREWGEAGYIRLQRTGLKHECEMDTTPDDGGGCKGGPKKVQVCGQCGIVSDSSYPTGGFLVNSSDFDSN